MAEQKLLTIEDLATGLQLQAMVMQAVAQLEAAQQAMDIWQNNIRYRYSAPESAGWRLERWTDGFVKADLEA